MSRNRNTAPAGETTNGQEYRWRGRAFPSPQAQMPQVTAAVRHHRLHATDPEVFRSRIGRQKPASSGLAFVGQHAQFDLSWGQCLRQLVRSIADSNDGFVRAVSQVVPAKTNRESLGPRRMNARILAGRIGPRIGGDDPCREEVQLHSGYRFVVRSAQANERLTFFMQRPLTVDERAGKRPMCCDSPTNPGFSSSTSASQVGSRSVWGRAMSNLAMPAASVTACVVGRWPYRSAGVAELIRHPAAAGRRRRHQHMQLPAAPSNAQAATGPHCQATSATKNAIRGARSIVVGCGRHISRIVTRRSPTIRNPHPQPLRPFLQLEIERAGQVAPEAGAERLPLGVQVLGL